MTLNLQGKLTYDPMSGKWKVRGGIEWCKTVLDSGDERQGYTANPVRGCQHGCRWEIDGETIKCYAETNVERFNPGTFTQHGWHPEVLDELRRRLTPHAPCRVFIDSMSDLFGAWVPREEVYQVLDTIGQLSHITFLSLTKNAPRLIFFQNALPVNLHVGISSPPDEFEGRTLTQHQKDRMLDTALTVLDDLPLNLTTFASFEPLSWDVSEIVAKHPDALNWAIIGAASHGRTYYQPVPDHLDRLEAVLRRFDVPVFYKGNLIRTPRREEFPA